VHQVQDPVSAAKQNHGTADNCRHNQDRHLNLLDFGALRDQRPQHQNWRKHAVEQLTSSPKVPQREVG
jgi:hypothetical protein